MAEPHHPVLPPECPEVLTDPLARQEWDRVAPLLIRQGHVTVVDRATLIAYCHKYAQWQALETEAAKHAFVVKTPSGTPISNPALRLANQTLTLLLKAAAELGITPTARSRVTAQAAAPAVSRWAGYLPGV